MSATSVSKAVGVYCILEISLRVEEYQALKISDEPSNLMPCEGLDDLDTDSGSGTQGWGVHFLVSEVKNMRIWTESERPFLSGG